MQKNSTYRYRRYNLLQNIPRKDFSPQISAEELLKYIPAAREFCTIDTVQPFSLDSTNVRTAHWLQLAQLIGKKNTNSTTGS